MRELRQMKRLKPDQSAKVLLSTKFEESTIQKRDSESITIPLETQYMFSGKVRKIADATKDSVQIFGEDAEGKVTPVRTDKKGIVQVDDTRFTEIIEEACVEREWCTMPVINVSQYKVYSFAIVNCSSVDIEAAIQISPNKEDYFTDIPPQLVRAEDVNVLVPKRFLKYARVVLRAKSFTGSARVKIYLQVQE